MTRKRARDPFAGVRRYSRQLVAVVALAFCLLLAVAFLGVAAPANATARDASALRAEIAKLGSDLQAKQAELVRRQSDQYVVDRAQDLGLVRPGEGLITVQRPDDGRTETRADARMPSRIERWLALFFR